MTPSGYDINEEDEAIIREEMMTFVGSAMICCEHSEAGIVICKTRLELGEEAMKLAPANIATLSRAQRQAVVLEAQQRYFSYRAMRVAVVSRNSFVLVMMGYRTVIARYVAKWGISQMCLCKTKYQGGGIAPFWGTVNLPEK